jgi:hypothetical protein
VSNERAIIWFSSTINSYRHFRKSSDPANARTDECRQRQSPTPSCAPDRKDTAQVCDIGASLFYVFADSGAYFDHRLDHFGFDLLTEQHPAFFQDLET